MQHIMIRVETQDYEAWLRVHYQHEADRRAYGMTDGPVYRDITDPNAALFHIHAADLDRALAWFSSPTFRDATQRATVTGREFYLAQEQARPQAGQATAAITT
jgi:hypothetical protein